jgi:hypothetical protein
MAVTLTKAISIAISEGKIKPVDFKVFTRTTLALESSTSADSLCELDKHCDVFYARHGQLTVFGVFTETGTILPLGPRGCEVGPSGFCSIPYKFDCNRRGVEPTARHMPRHYLRRFRDQKFLYDVLNYIPASPIRKAIVLDLTNQPANPQEERKDDVEVPSEKPQDETAAIPVQIPFAPKDARIEKKHKQNQSAETRTKKSRTGAPMTPSSFLFQKQPILHPNFPQGGSIYWLPVVVFNGPHLTADQRRDNKRP